MEARRQAGQALRRLSIAAAIVAGVVAIAPRLGVAQGRTVTVEVDVQPRVITVADGFQIQVVVSGAAGGIVAPELRGDGFVVTGQSQSSSTQIFNGRASYSTIFTYSARPTRSGIITIPPVMVSAGGQSYTSPRGASLEAREVPKRDDFFLELSASRERLFPEQELVLTLKIYAERLGGRYANQDPFATGRGTWPHLDIPWFEAMEGFESDDFQAYARQFNPSNSGGGFPVNGYSSRFGTEPVRFSFQRTAERRKDSTGKARDYFVYTVRKTFRAATIGSVVFAPVTARGHIFVDTAGGTPRAEQFTTQSNSVTVQVLEVPRDGRPETFTGGIGRFSIAARLARVPETIRVGDPLTLEVAVTGNGKLESVRPPSLRERPEFASAFRIPDEPELGEIDASGRTKTFTYSLRPRRSDVAAIPSIEMAFFDPETERFVTAASSVIPIAVEEGETVGSTDVRSFEDVSFVRRARKIREASYPNRVGPDALVPQPRPRGFTWGHAALLGAPPLLYAAAALWLARRRRAALDPRVARAREAGRRARSLLREALAATDGAAGGGELHDAVSRALRGFIADRAQVPSGGFTATDALRALEDQDVESTLRDALRALFDECEQARFGAGATTTSRDALGERANDLLRRLERALR